MPEIRKNSAASWWRSRPPRVRKDHSRLRTYDTIVATMIAMIFAVTGLSSRTVSFSRYQMPLSITNVVPPTTANLSSSRCLMSTARTGSGTRARTVSTAVTTAVYGEVPCDDRPRPVGLGQPDAVARFVRSGRSRRPRGACLRKRLPAEQPAEQAAETAAAVRGRIVRGRGLGPLHRRRRRWRRRRRGLARRCRVPGGLGRPVGRRPGRLRLVVRRRVLRRAGGRLLPGGGGRGRGRRRVRGEQAWRQRPHPVPQVHDRAVGG